jgi:SET domain-containing protein
MVLGYAQLYNHQDKNSAEITFDLKNQIADIIAVRDIKKSEEIFINYGPKYFKNKKKIDVDFEEEQSEEIEPHQVEKTKVQNISPAIFMETPVVNNDKKVYRPL